MQARFQRIYEINTRVWLAELVAQGHIPRPNLAEVPQAYLQTWQRWHVDAIWLMGVWEPSPTSARLGCENPAQLAELRQALEDFAPEDCIGSPYAVKSYTVSPLLGGLEGLLALRQRLNAVGIGLLLDFVPNHTACDHPWVSTHPEYYVQGTAEDVARAPEDYFPVTTATGATLFLAHGRDPYFAPWSDVAQLNYHHPALHLAMQEELLRIAQWCDGVRCDMTMLLLPDVFSRTWSRLALPPPPDFWDSAIRTVRRCFPDFCFVAEVYWQREAHMQHRGFTLTYDKEFYDALVAQDPAQLRNLLRPGRLDPHGCLRFLENHDEPRAAARFSPAQQRAAVTALLTLPGAVLLHDGQFAGRRQRTPVHLRRQPLEPVQSDLQDLYERLCTLPKVEARVFALLESRQAWDDNWTFRNLLAWAWWRTDGLWFVAINYSATQAQAYLDVHDLPFPAPVLRLTDLLDGGEYTRWREDLYQHGLYVDLPPYGSHVFEVKAAPAACGCLHEASQRG